MFVVKAGYKFAALGSSFLNPGIVCLQPRPELMNLENRLWFGQMIQQCRTFSVVSLAVLNNYRHEISPTNQIASAISCSMI